MTDPSCRGGDLTTLGVIESPAVVTPTARAILALRRGGRGD